MKVLVTGSAGYIGQHLCRMLADTRKDIEVHKFDIDEVDGDFSHKADVRVPACLTRLATKGIQFDTVIHLAALVRVGESVENPTEYYETNITGTINVLRNIESRNFIFASTGAAVDPGSPYGFSKRVAEDVVMEHCIKQNKDSTIFRFYNVIGTDGFAATNPDGLFYNLVRAPKIGTFKLYGTDYETKDGSCVREYVHVNDICRALIKAIGRPANSIENLAYGDTRTVKEIIDIFKQTNDVEFQVIDLPRRQGDLEACYLPNPSAYMERNYSYEQMLKI